MKLQLRSGLSLQIYTSGGEAYPFVVDEPTKYAQRISKKEAELFEVWARDEDVPTDETSEDEVQAAAERFRELGLVADGRGRHEIDAATLAQWRRDNEDALRGTLAFAAASMPMYEGRIPRSGDPKSLPHIPMLSKASLRRAFPAGYARNPSIISNGTLTGAFSIVESSGTTSDERSRVLSDNRRTELATVAGRFINRALWPSNELRQATFTTLHCAGLVCAREMPQMEMRIGATLTLLPPEDPTAPTTEEITRTLREIAAYGANVLYVHPAYLANLTWAALDRGMELPRMRCVVTTFEYRSKIHMRLLADAWQCPVYSVYAVSEIRGLPMVECERNVYHANERFVHFEVMRDGRPARPGEVGRLVATILRGRLPLVRYDTGDLLIVGEPHACTCGALQRVLGRLAGRARDTVSTPDGRILTTAHVDDVIATAEGVRFYQLARVSPHAYTLTVVADPKVAQARIVESVQAVLRPLLGDGAELDVQLASAVFPERSGKFRLTLSKLASEPMIRADSPEATESPEQARVPFAPLA